MMGPGDGYALHRGMLTAAGFLAKSRRLRSFKAAAISPMHGSNSQGQPMIIAKIPMPGNALHRLLPVSLELPAAVRAGQIFLWITRLANYNARP
jgi:hypothetical protein